MKDAGLRAQSGVMLKNLITFTCANCLSARQGSQAEGAWGQLGGGPFRPPGQLKRQLKAFNLNVMKLYTANSEDGEIRTFAFGSAFAFAFARLCCLLLHFPWHLCVGSIFLPGGQWPQLVESETERKKERRGEEEN